MALIIIPSIGQMALSFVAAVLMLVYAFQWTIVHNLATHSNLSTGGLALGWQRLLHHLHVIPEKVFLVVFWALIGAICYAVYLRIANAITGSVSAFMVRTSYTNTAPASEIIKNRLLRAGCAIAIAVALVLLSRACALLWVPLIQTTPPILLHILLGFLLIWLLAYVLLLGLETIMYLLEVAE